MHNSISSLSASGTTDGVHALDSLVYRDMFGSAAMRTIWSDRGLVQRWLDVEAALARAEAAVGLIPADAALQVTDACRLDSIDFEALREGANLVGYPILTLVRQIASAAGEDAGGYVHWGATTQDIMDTATALQVRDARLLIEADLEHVLGQLERLAAEHRDTVMAGRTHGQQALPITLGYKLAVYVAELRRHADRLRSVAPRSEFVEFAGAAGTLASVGAAGLEVQVQMARDLGLNVPPIAWHTSRDGLAEFACVLGLLAATLAKLAQEVTFLQRTEVAEVEEGYVSGRGGSSTMPQKRNPITSETIVGANRQVRQLVPALLDAMLHDNERATGPWHGEWLALPELVVLAHGIVARSGDLLEHLVVRPEAMRANLGMSGGQINAEAVMMALAPALGRQHAHEVVYAASMRAVEHGRLLRQELLDDVTIVAHLSAAEIDRLLAPESYLGIAPLFVDRVLGATNPDADGLTVAVWHVGITVADLERSVRFYCDGLGFAVRHQQEQRTTYTARLVGYPDAHLRIAQLTLPTGAPGQSGHLIELVQYLNPVGRAASIPTCDAGTAHLAFEVANIGALRARLESMGARFVSETQTITHGINRGGQAVYLRDPDGFTLELVQPPATPPRGTNSPDGRLAFG